MEKIIAASAVVILTIIAFFVSKPPKRKDYTHFKDNEEDCEFIGYC